MIVSVAEAAAVKSNGSVEPRRVCEYAAPPEGCRYVPGPTYDRASQCGMILECDKTWGDQPIGSVEVEGKIKSQSSATLVIPSINKECDGNYLKSADGGYCIKTSFSAKYKTSSSADNNASSDGEIPTMIISPSASENTSVIFEGQTKTRINDPSIHKEIEVGLEKNLRVIIDNQNPVSVEKDSSSGTIIISRGGVRSSLISRGTVEVNKNGRVLVSGKELTIMPDTVALATSEKLGGISGIQNIELKDDGENTAPSYEITVTKEAKLFGVIKIPASVTVNINAQTGSVIQIKKPWWSFLALF